MAVAVFGDRLTETHEQICYIRACGIAVDYATRYSMHLIQMQLESLSRDRLAGLVSAAQASSGHRGQQSAPQYATVKSAGSEHSHGYHSQTFQEPPLSPSGNGLQDAFGAAYHGSEQQLSETGSIFNAPTIDLSLFDDILMSDAGPSQNSTTNQHQHQHQQPQ